MSYEDHGHRHRFGGTDPIKGNLHWGTNTDDDGAGLVLESDTGSVNIDLAGVGNMDVSVAILQMVASDTAAITGPNLIQLLTSATAVTIDPTGGVEVVLPSGGALTVKDSGGNPIFRIDNDDGSVHIKTGGTIVADL